MVNFDRINADGGNMNTARRKFGKAFLETPQLGVAEWSPMSAIKDQDRAVG
jgi:hypothetical protein